jgi:hypothetical protein
MGQQYDDHAAIVVFVFGITGRSGTNYLLDLLTLHADCIAVQDIWEGLPVGQRRKTDQLTDMAGRKPNVRQRIFCFSWYRSAERK